MTFEELTADPALKAFEFMRTDRGGARKGRGRAREILLRGRGNDTTPLVKARPRATSNRLSQ